MAVVHQPRVAWQAARIFVAAAETDVYYWLSEVIGDYLGVMYELQLAETRMSLRAREVFFAEMGAWRARLDELLELHPQMTSLVQQLTAETAERLDRVR
jgi:hypothetical protein